MRDQTVSKAAQSLGLDPNSSIEAVQAKMLGLDPEKTTSVEIERITRLLSTDGKYAISTLATDSSSLGFLGRDLEILKGKGLLN